MGEGNRQGNEVMNYKGLAAYLGMAEGTLRHYVMREEIPFVKIGAHVRFLKGEIEKWLLERNRRPAWRGAVKGGEGEGLLPFEDKGQEI